MNIQFLINVVPFYVIIPILIILVMRKGGKDKC